MFLFKEYNRWRGGNINLIEDIIKIVQDDNRHTIKIEIEPVWLTIYLSDDPDDDYEEKYIIPIRYDLLTEGIYIADKEYKEMTEDNDTGIDFEEVRLIHKIMWYLDDNKETIKTYLEKLSVTRNESKNSLAS